MLNVLHSHIMYTDEQVKLICKVLSAYLGVNINRFDVYKAAVKLKSGHAFIFLNATEPIELITVHTDTVRASVHVGSFENLDNIRSYELTQHLKFALSEPV